MKKLLILLAALTLPMATAQAQDRAAAEAFFLKFADMINAYDQQVAALYSDQAQINTRRTDEEGKVETVNQHPMKWKRIMVLAMQLGKIRKDKTDFSDIEVIDQGNGLFKIKANRYSHLLCYTDKGYFQKIQVQATGDFLIVEEYLETQAVSSC